MAWNTGTVSVGSPTKKTEYDRVMSNLSLLRSGTSFVFSRRKVFSGGVGLYRVFSGTIARSSLYKALTALLPATNDWVIANGGLVKSGTVMILARVLRLGATSIAVYGLSVGGVVTTLSLASNTGGNVTANFAV